MNTEPVDPDDKRTWQLKVAHGAMWMMIWLGFGGCCLLSNLDLKLTQ